MGARLFATLAVVGMAATGVLVGMTMASGTWTVVGTQLAPGAGYALQLGSGGDRLRVELANASDDARASFSVYAPSGDRAGFFDLQGGQRTAEVAAQPGIWLVFVYQSHGGDLTLAAHGPEDAARVLPADLVRKEIVLGERDREAALNASFTALLDKEPVLAGVYLQGSSRGLHSELRTEEGLVEVIDDASLSATASGMVVESHGARLTMPANLTKGAYTAEVRAEGLQGTLRLAALYMNAPSFAVQAQGDAYASASTSAEASAQGDAKGNATSNATSSADSNGTGNTTVASNTTQSAQPAPAPKPAAGSVAACAAQVRAKAPSELDVQGKGSLKLSLDGSTATKVRVYDGKDALVGVAALDSQHAQAELQLAAKGRYVLYSGNATVHAVVQGAGCAARELATKVVTVAQVREQAMVDQDEVRANFTMALPPLEFGLRLASVDGYARDLTATFDGPKGAAAVAKVRAEAAFFDDLGLRLDASDGAAAEMDATAMVPGAWSLTMDSLRLNGDVEAYAVEYVR